MELGLSASFLVRSRGLLASGKVGRGTIEGAGSFGEVAFSPFGQGKLPSAHQEMVVRIAVGSFGPRQWAFIGRREV